MSCARSADSLTLPAANPWEILYRPEFAELKELWESLQFHHQESIKYQLRFMAAMALPGNEEVAALYKKSMMEAGTLMEAAVAKSGKTLAELVEDFTSGKTE